LQHRCDPGRAEQVDFYRGVEGRIEADRGGRMHHRRTGREQFSGSVVEAETVNGDVAGDRDDAPGGFLVKTFAELAPETLEAVVAQDVSFNPVFGPTPARPDEQDDLCVGQAPQYPLR
jgi:hypothetical protein